MILENIGEYSKGKYVRKIYTGSSSLTTSWGEIKKDKVPAGYVGILIELAADNTVSAELDFKIEGKSASFEGFPLDVRGFPANIESIYPMTFIEEKKEYKLEGRGIGASVTLEWRMIILLIKK